MELQRETIKELGELLDLAVTQMQATLAALEHSANVIQLLSPNEGESEITAACNDIRRLVRKVRGDIHVYRRAIEATKF